MRKMQAFDRPTDHMTIRGRVPEGLTILSAKANKKEALNLYNSPIDFDVFYKK